MPRHVTTYDPNRAPNAESWLALDESERIELTLRYHRHVQVRLPNARMHAVIHCVVETQIAMRDETPVREVMQRLQAEGLDRHEAIHAVGSVLAKRIYDLMKEGAPTGDPNETYRAELNELSAEVWKHAR